MSKSGVYFKQSIEQTALVKDVLIASGQKTCNMLGQRDIGTMYCIYTEDPSNYALCRTKHGQMAMVHIWLPFFKDSPLLIESYCSFLNRFSVVCHKPTPAYTCFYMCAKKRFSEKMSVGFTIGVYTHEFVLILLLMFMNLVL